MAWTERYANFDLATGGNDGTSEANAWQTPAAVIAGVAAGDRVNIKRQSAPFESSGTLTFSTAGTQTAPIWYRGYTTTIGDGGKWQLNLGTTAHNLVVSGAYSIVDSFDISTSTGANSIDQTGNNSWLINSRIVNSGTQNPSIRNASRCYFDLGRSRANWGGTNSNNATITDCVFRRNGIAPTTGSEILAISMTNRSALIANCAFIGDGLADINGIDVSVASSVRFMTIRNNRFYNVNHGISIADEPDAVREDLRIQSNVFSVCAGRAINMVAASYLGYVQHFSNAFHNCTSGYTNYPDEAIYIPQIALTSSPFVNAAGGDFAINDTSDGGQLCTAFGFPINMPLDTNGDLIATFRGSGGGGGFYVSQSARMLR